jgi:hypothetical protein
MGISGAKGYADKFSDDPERVWGKRTYQEIRVTSPTTAQVKVLLDWRQEGHDGVMTFTFDLVRESGRWKIAAVMY